VGELNRPVAGPLWDPRLLLTAWLPAMLITALHYLTGPEYHWFHDVLRRLYYLPILFAAFSHGLRGGLVLAVAVALAYSPHAFTHLMHMDPAHTLEKSLELLLYVVVGVVAGGLVDRLRRRQQELVETTDKLKKALEEQRRTADQLVRAGRLAALGELVSGIAHELKNPLHALRGTAEVVDGAVPKDAPQRPMWELHLKEIDRLGDTAERFLSFARPTPLERVEVELISVLKHTRDLIEAQARQQGVELKVVAIPRGLTVMADQQQLIQVLLNIMLNAVQALAETGGAVTCSLARSRRGEREYVEICVADDGPSIPPPEQERIFDPFVTTKSEGSGLGLSIAARIVEQHDGFIEVREPDDRPGVVFVVLLPA